MSEWNMVDAIYQLGAGDLAERPALIHADQRISFAELRRRASGIAAYLQDQGIPRGAHIGHYMRNSPAYIETWVGGGLVGMSHVNVNYRYLDDELVDLCNALDLQVLVYDAEFSDRVVAIRDRLPKVRVFLQVGTGDLPTFAKSFASLYDYDTSGLQLEMSPDDLVLIATGGTTGLPKGTCWRQEDLWFRLGVSTRSNLQLLGLAEHPASIAEHLANVASLPTPQPFLSLSPLMHGAAFLMTMLILSQGVALVTLPSVRFDSDEALDTIKQVGVGNLVLVGDAFAMPLLETLDRRRDENLLAPLQMMVSSGAAMSKESRAGLEGHRPELIIVDTLGSTEASGFAIATSEPGVFDLLPSTRVLDDDLQDLVPGSGVIGMAYAGGPQPIGYYKSPEKSAETFVEVDGERYVKTGDRCTLRADGKLVLLGRDSTVVNTGGEKVYTVEVERALTDYPTITDAIVIGLPHPRFGKMVVAVVEGPGLSSDNLDVQVVQAHIAAQLADYKVPRKIFVAPSLQRTANGKPDYKFVTQYAEQSLAAEQA
jgi:acyl-CoA synthetase (AMP-forming)/AMP-acid ligase II